MRVIHLSAAAIAALLCAPTPTAALGISPLPQIFGDEDSLPIERTLVEFDVDDWTAFIRGGKPAYELDRLGSGIERLVAFDEHQPIRLGERALTQASARP